MTTMTATVDGNHYNVTFTSPHTAHVSVRDAYHNSGQGAKIGKKSYIGAAWLTFDGSGVFVTDELWSVQGDYSSRQVVAPTILSKLASAAIKAVEQTVSVEVLAAVGRGQVDIKIQELTAKRDRLAAEVAELESELAALALSRINL